MNGLKFTRALEPVIPNAQAWAELPWHDQCSGFLIFSPRTRTIWWPWLRRLAIIRDSQTRGTCLRELSEIWTRATLNSNIIAGIGGTQHWFLIAWGSGVEVNHKTHTHPCVSLAFFFSWVVNTQLDYWTKRVMSTRLIA